MKKILFVLLILLQFPLSAQNPDAESRLKSKYSLVQYSGDCGGWYLLSYNKSGQQLYGFADNLGNVVATDASQYKLHPGYIELYLLDLAAKSKHDQWIQDCKAYDRAYREYVRVNKAYEAEMSAYKTKYEAARTEATYRWKRAQEYARKKAELEAAQRQRQTSGTSVLGAVLSGLANGISVAAAVSAVKFEPFLSQVLGERDLLVEPSKPYNPMPTKPIEPPTGYYWKSFPLKQPNRYEYIDFASISESGRYADVKSDGKWGLVDSKMNEVVPCSNNEKVLQTSYEDGKFLLKSHGKYGVITAKGEYVLPLEFASIERHRRRFKVSKAEGYGLYSDEGKEVIPCEFQQIDQQHGYWLCCKNGAWGVYTRDFDELYPCQFQDAKLVSNSGKLMLYNKSKGLWGAIDFLAGTELLPNNYSSIEYASYGDVGSFYKVCADSKYGLYSHTGIIIIPCAYSDITFKNLADEMMIEVKKGTKHVGLYEPSGIQVLSADKYISYAHEGSHYKVVDENNNVGICDLFGTELVPCKYGSLNYNQQIHGFIASKGATKGVVSFTGRELFPFVNVNSLDVYSGRQEVLVVGNGEEKGYGFIDYDGNVVVPMKNKFTTLYKKVDKAMKKFPAIPDMSLAKRETLSDDWGQKLEMEEKELNERQNFSFFAQNYVERVVGEWQKKGEFEKLDDWRKRVNNNTLNQRVFALTKEAQAIYVDDCKKMLPQDNPHIVGAYDPDNETYRISTSYSDEDILVRVDTKDALEFKSSFSSLKKQAEFFVENDRIGLAEYVFTMPNGNKYKYSNQASLTYSVANVKYNLESIEIDKSALSSVKKGKQTISTSTFMFGTSDVDINIPVSEQKRPNTFALIIANENYDNERKVEYAYNDGQVLKDYCLKTLGIPADNVHFRPDATLNNMKFEIGWLRTVTKAYPDAKVLVYYAGHGMPDEYTRDSYLLPVDGHSSDIKTTGYRLSELYATLGELPADNVLVMLDACFSGVDRTGEAISNVRGVKVVPKKDRPSGNMIVFSATSGQQAANPYQEQSHGFFTYYLLKKLKETGGKVNYGDWFDYVKTNVAQKTVVTIQREQTPTVMPSASVAQAWRMMTL